MSSVLLTASRVARAIEKATRRVTPPVIKFKAGHIAVEEPARELLEDDQEELPLQLVDG